MAIIHVVLVSFKPEATPENVAEVNAGMLALKDNCLHATTQTPYIKSLTGGINNSPESHTDGRTHGFVVEFASLEDRDYYLKKDSAHLSLIASAGPFLEKITVLDYEAGVF